jgi:hypothetical protein
VDNASGSEPEDPLNHTPNHTPTGTYTIYIPTFLDAIHQSERLVSNLNVELLHQNWLTPDLVREIEDCFPTKEQISNTPDGDNIRDLEAFKVKAAKLLPTGRIFDSFKQLEQVSKMFLDAWAINKKVHLAKRICCFYSESPNKKRRLHDDPAKHQKVDTSVKGIYKCPFAIRYSFINYSKTPPINSPISSTGSRSLE